MDLLACGSVSIDAAAPGGGRAAHRSAVGKTGKSKVNRSPLQDRRNKLPIFQAEFAVVANQRS
jgi:hypothetical protein